MKMTMWHYGWVFLTVACSPFSAEKAATQNYFDLKNFISHHVRQLTEENPTVFKKISFSDKQETTQQKISDWEKELALFLDADLNKPVLKGMYSMQISAENDTIITTYVANAFTDGVEKMQIWQKSQEIIRIVVVTKKYNYLYENQKKLELLLDSGRLKEYIIDNRQKVRGSDTDYYRVAGYIEKR